MGSVAVVRIKADLLDPSVHNTSVLPRAEVWRRMQAARKEIVLGTQRRELDPCLNRFSGWKANSRIGLVVESSAAGQWLARPPDRRGTRPGRAASRDQPRSLLSIPRSNRARSRVRACIWSRTRMAQISLTFNGAFGPTSFPLFHGPYGPQWRLRPSRPLIFWLKGGHRLP